MGTKSFFFIPLFFISLLVYGQNEKKLKKVTSDPDSVGEVNSALLPTTMPLLLFDEEKKKTHFHEILRVNDN